MRRAADVTLSGHEVRFAVFPEQKDQLPEVRKAGREDVLDAERKLVCEAYGVDPWQCGPSLADMDFAGSPEAAKRRVLGSR